jgi:tetratricopeptide (TPR) repeat protein
MWAFSFFLFFFASLVSSAQFTDRTFDGAFLSLKDGIGKVDSLNKLCRKLDDNGKAIACEIKVMQLAKKISYKKGIAQSLNNIGVAYYNLDKGKQALEYHQQALTIRKELLEQMKQNGNQDEIGKCKKDISASYTNAGNAYDNLGDKKKAIEYHTKSLELRQEIKDTVGMARSYNNIASAYLDLPDYYKAIDFGFKAVKLYDAIKEKSDNLANALNNIGLGYQRVKEFVKALDYYQKALLLQKELGHQNEIAKLLDNIAGIYSLQGKDLKDNSLRRNKFSSALENYSKSLSILEESDDKYTLALVSNNIGNTYWELNDFPQALSYLNKSLELYKQLGSQSDIALALNSLAIHFQLQKKFTQSEKYAIRAFAIADSVHDAEQIKNASEILSGDYFDLKQFEKSLYYYKKYTAEKDTLTNVEGAKNLVQKESQMEFEKREQQLKFDQDKKDAIALGEKRKQQIITWSVIVGLLLVVVFAGFIFRSLRVTRKQNHIIELQKTEVEQQKKKVEEHQKEIIDSITYAKRLQEAILPPNEYVKKYLPDSFILYTPKDIVAGDFYWMEVRDNIIFIAAADCTGHGVPGAMVSLVCSNALNRTIKEFGLRDTGKILDKVTDLVIETFEKSDTDVKDGMDISLLAINKITNEIHWSGANNPLWYIQEGKLIDITANKQPIGKYDNRKPFTTHTINLSTLNPELPTTFYLFTDGYADQFGGPKGKKFKYKQLEGILLVLSDKSLAEQKELLGKTLSAWKGNLEQVDDVCIIGIKI